MKFIHLNCEFLNLAGEPMRVNMAEALADELAASNVGDPRKMMHWAQSLLNAGTLEVSPEEEKFLKDFILHSRFNNLARAQLLEKIENAECGHTVKLKVPETLDDLTEEIGKKIIQNVNSCF